jgi:cyclopropane-fatty-acyl-phospholipid synthase
MTRNSQDGPPVPSSQPVASLLSNDGANVAASSVLESHPESSGLLTALEIGLFRRMWRALGAPPLQVVLWNGEEITPADSSPVGRILIRDHRTLRRLFLNPSLAFGESYSTGRLELEGSLIDVLAVLYRALEKVRPTGLMGRLLQRRTPSRRGHSISVSRESVHHHYDIGNEFYQLWLDDEMLYTCAYFPTSDATLEQAQVAKMDHVCRKLQLSPGQQVIEAGCGWGALALHMARKYGVSVRAYNVSREQIAFARRRASEERLEDRVEFVEDDYRNASGTCDAFVSVGMLEHVGHENYGDLSAVIDRVLKHTGRALIHSIGRNVACSLDPWIEKRIFPGAYPPSLREMMDIFEPAQFSVLDVENLRLHYYKTCQHWLHRFEQVMQTVANMFDNEFVRAWRLYLAGSAASFLVGDLQLFQVVFARHDNNDVPWTRSHLYTT